MLVYGECECFVMQMLYVCVYPVAVLNAAFCMTCSLLMLVEDAIGDHTEEAYSRAERRDMGLYEVPLFVSLLGFGIGTMLASFHV